MLIRLGFLFLFSCFSETGSSKTVTLTDEQQKRQRGWDLQDRDYQDKKDAEQEKRDAKAEEDRLTREQLKDLQEQCRQADRDVVEALKDKQGEAREWEDKFHDSGRDITELEEKLSEQQVEIRNTLDKLKQESNNNVQELKDDMGRELKGIDAQVARVSEKIAELNRELEKVEDSRLDAYYARRKLQNGFYSQCFGEALSKAEKDRKVFYDKKRSRRAKRNSMGALMTGGKQQNKTVFSGQFNSYLHLCMNHQQALLAKQNMKNDYQLQMEKLKRAEERTQAQIGELRQQIQKLNTHDKAEVVARFKQKMEIALNNFNQTYEKITTNYQTSSQNAIQQIDKIKKIQASHLMKRAEAVPQKSRSMAISQQCQGQDMFNMFPKSENRGLFNSSVTDVDTAAVR